MRAALSSVTPKFVKNVYRRLRSRKSRFCEIYLKSGWGSAESRSGAGSSLEATSSLRAWFPGLCHRLQVRSILDIPCGDFNWMHAVLPELQTERYVGADIVPALIAENTSLYSASGISFCVMDLVADELPPVDLLLCRDCLVHLPLSDCQSAIRNILRSGAKYFAATTFPSMKENRDIPVGLWRPMNLQAAPFLFPQPVELLVEGCADEPEYSDKSLGVWRISDLAFQSIHAR